MKLLVNVTAEDIARGKREACRSCPVALALTRTYTPRNGAAWKVYGWDATIEGSHGMRRVRLGGRCESFVREFDSNLDVEPFSFEFEMDDALADELLIFPPPPAVLPAPESTTETTEGEVQPC